MENLSTADIITFGVYVEHAESFLIEWKEMDESDKYHPINIGRAMAYLDMLLTVGQRVIKN